VGVGVLGLRGAFTVVLWGFRPGKKVHCRYTPAWGIIVFFIFVVKAFSWAAFGCFLFFSLLFFHIVVFSGRELLFLTIGIMGVWGGLGLDASLLLLLRENILVRPRL